MNDFWTYLIGVSTAISAIGMILVTYHIYSLTNESGKKEHYFTHMVELYNRIEDDLRILTDEEKEDSHAFLKAQCARRIKVNSTIMIYYLQRMPVFYKGRMDFVRILNGLSNTPYDKLYHSKLSEMFVDFCWELRDKKTTSNTYSFNYDGKPLK